MNVRTVDDGRTVPGLDVQALFEDIDEAVLRARRGAKWTRYGNDVLPAWVADMDYPVAPVVAGAMRGAIEAGDLGYPPDAPSSGLRELFAARAMARWQWAVDPALVHVLADVVRGIESAIATLSAPGDAIVVTTPIYPPFLKVVGTLGRRVVDVALRDDGALDLAGLERAFASERPPLMLLCNPHNPTGHVPSERELTGLAHLAASHDVIVVSDEIHADLVYPGHTHRPLAAIGGAAARTVTLTSASKAFNVAGLRCALEIPGTAALAERVHGDGLHHAVGSLGIVATHAAWSPAGEAWLQACLARLERNRDVVAAWAAANGVGHRPPDATYLAWLDFRGHDLGDNPSKWLLDNARVALSAGPDFGERGAGWARLNFATTPTILAEILDRMSIALARTMRS